LKVTDPGDRQLFFCSTMVSVGDGKGIHFWEARWLDGIVPKELAPNLFQVARYKTRTVYTELQNNNWIRNLKNINNSTQMEEFVLLFIALLEVQLSKQRDAIF
jgi:hypothetical protein